MKVILLAVYGVAALFALLCGLVYPAAQVWSYLAVGSCGLHLALAFTRAALSTGGRAESKFLSLRGVLTRAALSTGGRAESKFLSLEKGFYASGVHLNNNAYSVFGDQTDLPGVTKFYNSFLALPSGWWVDPVSI